MSLLAVISKHGGCEYINLALAERLVPLGDGCVEVLFSRSVVTLSGVDGQRALQWAQQQSALTMVGLEHSSSRPTTAPPSKPQVRPQAPTPLTANTARTLNLPSFNAEQQPDSVSRPTEPSWRLR